MSSSFITSYAEENAISLPGRIPGYKDYKILLLPSDKSKHAIHNIYQVATAPTSFRSVAYSTFCAMWNKYVPYIIVTKPRSDLCWQCMKNNNSIIRSRNFSEDFRTETYKRAVEHLQLAKQEREYYKITCTTSAATLKTFYSENDIPPPNCCLVPASNQGEIHYSFDYAQQVHYPSNPMQPGPIYFLAQRKCSIFGVCCEAIPRQLNFIIDEIVDCGKGANSVCSMLHYFFEHHGLGESDVHLHADNCCGQNKNHTLCGEF